jgi:hypothetical protein
LEVVSNNCGHGINFYVPLPKDHADEDTVTGSEVMFSVIISQLQIQLSSLAFQHTNNFLYVHEVFEMDDFDLASATKASEIASKVCKGLNVEFPEFKEYINKFIIAVEVEIDGVNNTFYVQFFAGDSKLRSHSLD